MGRHVRDEVQVKAPERVETNRLCIRRPRSSDAEAIYNYSSDNEVTRFLSWPRHLSLDATQRFLEVSESEWADWPAGPYVVESLEDGSVLGGTGFAFETPYRAATGYVFAKDSWGQGFATEALGAMVDIAGEVGVHRLYALCHTEHRESRRVLEKCGFNCEGVLHRHSEFPNLSPSGPCDVFCYAFIFKKES